MGKDIKEFERIMERLRESKSEDEIMEHLTTIVKGFGSCVYKEILLSNPYYRDLLHDVKEEVLQDIGRLREAIAEEIQAITEEIGKSKNSKKLEELRNDCLHLMIEIDLKEKEIKSII